MKRGTHEMNKEWTETTVGCVADVIMGQSPPSSTYNSIGNGLPFFQGKADFTSFNPVPSKWCTKPLRQASRKDILISVRAPVGDVNMSARDCCIGRGLAALSCKSEASPFFLFFFLLSSKEGVQRSGTGTTFQSINKKVLEQLAIPLPPLPEQKKIAAVLLKIQRAIETQEKIIQSLSDLKKSTMQHIFTHGLRGEKTKMTEIGEIPKSWVVQRLGEIADITAGGTPSRNNRAYWQNGIIPWVKTGEINYCIITATDEHITKLGLENSSAKLFPPGTLLLAMYGQGITRGKVAVLGIEAATNQATAAIIPRGSFVKTPFVYHYLTWSYERLRSHGHGAQQANLNAKIVAEFPITISSQEEQEDIATALDRLDRKVLVHESQKSAFQDLFKTTLSKLMTGEIRVGDLDIDVSEVEG